jgi:hypothetical protein
MGKKLKILIGVIGAFLILVILAGISSETPRDSKGGEITATTETPITYEYHGTAVDLVKKGLSKTPKDYKLRFNENETFDEFLKMLGFEQIIFGVQEIERPSGIVEISSGEGLILGEAVHLIVIKFNTTDSATAFYSQLKGYLII